MDSKKALELQLKIRRDAQAQSAHLQGFAEWARDISEKDEAARGARPTPPPPVRGGARLAVRNSPATASEAAAAHAAAAAPKAGATAAAHTYDQGYKRWETFEPPDGEEGDELSQAAPAGPAPAFTPHTSASRPPPARPLEEARHPEEAQRLLGNDKFAAGDLEGAIRCYSICLGLKKGNVAAFANRAACYLKHRSV